MQDSNVVLHTVPLMQSVRMQSVACGNAHATARRKRHAPARELREVDAKNYRKRYSVAGCSDGTHAVSPLLIACITYGSPYTFDTKR